MKISIEGASEEFAEKLLALAVREGGAELSVATTGWSTDRAECYLRSLNAGARRFAQLVVDGEGHADARLLRDKFAPRALRGPANALASAVKRGVREGWWPEGTEAPISVVYDPENPSWQKAVAYVMSRENVPHFREAIARLDGASTQRNRGSEDAPRALSPAFDGADTDNLRALIGSSNLPDAEGR